MLSAREFRSALRWYNPDDSELPALATTLALTVLAEAHEF